MKKHERVTRISIIVILILVSIGDLIGILDQWKWLAERIPAITLLALTSAIGYWLSVKERAFDKLDNIERLTSLSGVGVQTLKTTEEAIRYLEQRFVEAQYTIDQVATAPSLTPATAYSKYDRTLTKILRKGVIKYRHIVTLDATRWKRVRSFLLNPKINRYYAVYYDIEPDRIPSFSYAIVDNNEIIMRYPYTPEQPEFWISIKHPEVVRLFIAYTQNLWSQGKRLDARNPSQIDKIDKRFGLDS